MFARKILLLFLLFFSSFSFADTIPATLTSGCLPPDVSPTVTVYRCWDGYTVDAGGCGIAEPLDQCLVNWGLYEARYCGISGGGFVAYLGSTQPNTTYVNSGADCSIPYSCPSGYTLDAGGVTCSTAECVLPLIRLPDGSCGRDCASLNATNYQGYIPASANPGSVCQDGCAASVVSASNQASVDGQQVIAGTFSYSGATCVGNDITSGTPPVCPAGQCVGLINGANACFTCSNINQTATTYTATSDSTIKTTTYNSDGSTTTSITDSVSGTTSSPVTVQKTEQQTYCEQNPTALSCLDTESVPATPVSEPGLEAVPTGSDSFSFIKDFVIIQPANFSHVSQCPTSSFDWNGQTFIINQHCALISDHWSVLSVAMLTVWTVLSMIIVLKA